MDPWLIAIVAAFIPAIAWLALFYVRDRHEKEPIRAVLIFFGLGSVLAVPLGVVLIPAVLGSVADALGLVAGNVPGVFLVFLLFAGLPEEGIKAAVALFRARSEPDLDEPADGMIYFTSVGLGFGALETVLYIIGTYAQVLPTGGEIQAFEAAFFQVAVVRALTATVGHGLWSGIVGYYYARSRFAAQPRGWFLPGVAIAALAHAAYNTASVSDLWLGAAILVATMAVYFTLLNRAVAGSPHAPAATG